MNPSFCGLCLETAPVGGAEIELTMLFADVRGSTSLAEGMGAAEFSDVIQRFFSASTRVLVKTNALIDRLIGDEVIALFIPGFVGDAQIDLPCFGEGAGVAVRKGNEDLVQAFNNAIQAIRADGSYEALSMKYFGTDIYGAGS